MTGTEEYIEVLTRLKLGELGVLRAHAGQGLDESLEGFDLFAGLWWPLRQKTQWAPERRSAWLVAKLFGAVRVPHVRAAPKEIFRGLAAVLGREERRQKDIRRFRQRFDTLLLSPLSGLEPHLRWALGVARDAVGKGRERGIDWVKLLDDLGRWHRKHKIRERWAADYLGLFKEKGETHVDRDSHDSESCAGQP